MKHLLMRSVRLFIYVFSLIFLANMAFAAEAITPAEKLRRDTAKIFMGKTVVFVTSNMGSPIDDERVSSAAKEAEAAGIKFILRDCGLDPMKQTQAVAALLTMKPKPDFAIVQSLNASLLQNLLKKVEEAGIYVVQIAMPSHYLTDAFVGPDMNGLGRVVAADLVKACGKGSGKSGKVAILQGDPTSPLCAEQNAAINAYFKNHPEMQVVINQGVNWDANTAHDVIATVIKQHPDLCAIQTDWQGYGLGAAQAVAEAKMSDKIITFVQAELTPAVAQFLKNGKVTALYYTYPYNQGHDSMVAGKTLLQIKKKPGTFKLAFFTPTTKITKENVDRFIQWTMSTNDARKIAEQAEKVRSGEPTYFERH